MLNPTTVLMSPYMWLGLLGSLLAYIYRKKNQKRAPNASKWKDAKNIYDFDVVGIDGNDVSLNKYKYVEPQQTVFCLNITPFQGVMFVLLWM